MNGQSESGQVWVRTGQGTRGFSQPRVVIGREQVCDVVVSDPRASRHHLTLERTGDSWFAVDSSTGGTYTNGTRISREPLSTQALNLALGDPAGEVISVWQDAPAVSKPPQHLPPPYQPSARQPTPPAASQGPASPQFPAPQAGAQPLQSQRPVPPPYQPPAPPPYNPQPVAQQILPDGKLQHGQTVFPAGLAPGRSLKIGRDLSNDVVLNDPLVSRFHARLDMGTPAVIHDLGSFNGVFVNGARVQGSARLDVGTEVILGNQTFRWDGSQLMTSATTHEYTLYADGLSVVVGDGKRLIDNMSFQLAPASLTAVIGPSGAGKSTLLGSLTGLRPATHGRVIWQGHDLYQHYDQLRFQIGLVPQQDIQHPQLKVQQALGYAAELRLPPDTGPQERQQRVAAVAHQLQLTQRLDNRIGTQLSGGQKKRVSIATELLTAPPLLFLDEPTSGLDPGLDLEVMKQLRTLADDGRVVMVVTHSVLALDVCDNVMVLAPGGRIAYFGPPSGVLDHFGVRNYPQVFDMLDDHDLWQRISAPDSNPPTGQVQPVASAVPAPPRQSIGKQLSTLVRRNLAVVMADRLLLTMLIALPLVLGLLSQLVPGSNGFSLQEGLGEEDGVSGPTQRLVVLIVGACLMGLALTIRELVGERPIFQREYAVGLSPGVYFASKVLVLGSATFAQGVLLTFIAALGRPGPDGTVGLLRVAFIIGLLAAVTSVAGLAVSALVTSNEQTMPALVGLIMLQLVLSGALFQIHGRVLLEQIAWLSPSRWAYAGAAGAVGLRDIRDGGRYSDDTITSAGAGYFLLALFMLTLLAGLTYVVGYFLTKRSATATD